MSLDLVSLYSEVNTVEVKWLWYPYIPIGKITLLQGDPGDGKSSMMMDIIAKITTGGNMPDGSGFGEPMRAIYQCSEDSVSDTIKPRLLRSGADCTKVAFLDEEKLIGITLSDERLRDAIQLFRPSLLVIDPFQSYLGNDTDMQIAGKVRKVLQRLGLWASTYDCAVVLIGHLNKSENQKSLYRGLGSIDIAAVARSVLQVERDSNDNSIRYVTQVKNNLGPLGQKLSFTIDSYSGFCWNNEDVHNDKVVASERLRSQTEKAAYIMKQCLQNNDMPAQTVKDKLTAEGISRRIIDITKNSLGISSYRIMRKWYWSLKPHAYEENDE